MKMIAIVGPTASGKSALAVELAGRIDAEIISCDSMQLYRGMDIGTAKPTAAEMGGIPHHLLDIADPSEPYSAADYAIAADLAAREITARGRMPVLCGGTGLYLEALRGARHRNAPGGDQALRASLLAEAEEEGGALRLHARLAALDPDAAAAIHPNNLRRVVRALELCMLTGKTKTALDAESREAPPDIRMLIFCLTFSDRALLAERINRRVDLMLKAGLVEEARRLWEAGRLCPGSTAEQAIGYRQLLPYLAGEITLEAASEEIKTATRRYAKRQMTWFRRTEGAVPLSVDVGGRVRSAAELADEILPHIREFMK